MFHLQNKIWLCLEIDWMGEWVSEWVSGLEQWWLQIYTYMYMGIFKFLWKMTRFTYDEYISFMYFSYVSEHSVQKRKMKKINK